MELDWTKGEGSRTWSELCPSYLFAKVNCSKAKDIAQERRKTIFFPFFSPQKESKKVYVNFEHLSVEKSVLNSRYSTGILKTRKCFTKKAHRLADKGTGEQIYK